MEKSLHHSSIYYNIMKYKIYVTHQMNEKILEFMPSRKKIYYPKISLRCRRLWFKQLSILLTLFSTIYTYSLFLLIFFNYIIFSTI